MFGKFGKWLFGGIVLVAAACAMLTAARKTADFVQKENIRLAQVGGQAVEALRSAGKAGQTFLSRAGEAQMTLLFTGLDEGWRIPDAILLVSVDLDRSAISAITIVPDTYINRAPHTLGSVYSAAASQAIARGDSTDEAVRKGNIALKGFLKTNMGIEIDHHLAMNRTGLSELVDSIGGVTVKLPTAIDHSTLQLEAGNQTLSGAQAAAFVSLPDAAAGESVNPEKLLLSALFRTIRTNFSLSTATGLLKTAFSRTVSDLALPDLIPLAKGLLGRSSSKVKMTALPTADCANNACGCQQLVRQECLDCLESYLLGQTFDRSRFDRQSIFVHSAHSDN